MEEQRAKPNRSDIQFRILCLQLITVAIILALAVCLRLFGGKTYKKLSVIYHERFDDITRASDVLEPNDNSSDGSESYLTEGEVPDLGAVEYELYDELIDGSERGYVEALNTTEYTDAVSVDVAANSFMLPISGTVTSEYGMRTNPVTGRYILHGGIDIANVTGTEIRCAFDGVVSDSGYSDSYGNYVIISHGANVKTLYAHCSELMTESGKEVKKGEPIALVGSTGRSTGPHLHFEVRIGGNRVDPSWLLGEAVKV